MNKKFLVFFISIGIMIITIFPAMPYYSATFPAMLGGYKVLAVLTPEDIACMLSGRKSIVLQTSEPNVHEYLEGPKPITEIREYLRQIPGEEETSWQIQVVGPGATLERISSTIESWNWQYPNLIEYKFVSSIVIQSFGG